MVAPLGFEPSLQLVRAAGFEPAYVTVFETAALPFRHARVGRSQGIRTLTETGLSRSPLPLGYAPISSPDSVTVRANNFTFFDFQQGKTNGSDVSGFS